MKCTHLITKSNVSSCSALDKPYVPSLFEIMEYCTTHDHRKCPFLVRDIGCLDRVGVYARPQTL